MEAKAVNFKTAKGIKSAFLVIVCCFILAVCVFHFVLGDPANFMNNDPNNHPLPGNFKGTIYKGGVIVPVLQTLFLTVIVLSIERHHQGQRKRQRHQIRQEREGSSRQERYR